MGEDGTPEILHQFRIQMLRFAEPIEYPLEGIFGRGERDAWSRLLLAIPGTASLALAGGSRSGKASAEAMVCALLYRKVLRYQYVFLSLLKAIETEFRESLSSHRRG